MIHNCPQCGFTYATVAGEMIHCRICAHAFMAPNAPPPLGALQVYLLCPICGGDLKGTFLKTVSCAKCRASYRLDEEAIENLNPHETTITASAQRACARCGAKNHLLAVMCLKCGTRLDVPPAVAPPPIGPMPVPSARPSPPAAPAPPAAGPRQVPSSRRTRGATPPARRIPLRAYQKSVNAPGSPEAGLTGGLTVGLVVAAVILFMALIIVSAVRSGQRDYSDQGRSRIVLTRPADEPCKTCRGKGCVNKNTPQETICPACDGSGIQ